MAAVSEPEHRLCAIVREEDVGALRRTVARMATTQRGLRPGAAELVATELGTNLVRYAERGYVLVRKAGDGIELISVDHGPGLPPGALAPTTDLGRTPETPTGALTPPTDTTHHPGMPGSTPPPATDTTHPPGTPGNALAPGHDSGRGPGTPADDHAQTPNSSRGPGTPDTHPSAPAVNRHPGTPGGTPAPARDSGRGPGMPVGADGRPAVPGGAPAPAPGSGRSPGTPDAFALARDSGRGPGTPDAHAPAPNSSRGPGTPDTHPSAPAVNRHPGTPGGTPAPAPNTDRRPATPPGAPTPAGPPYRGGGLNAGLNVVRRHAVEFDCYSTRRGTVVYARLGTAPAESGPWRFGAVNIPYGGDGESGDAWAVTSPGTPYHPFGPAPDRLLATMVVDGLGHGPAAAAASRAAITTLERGPVTDLDRLIQRTHEKMRATRGGVLGVCLIDSERGELTYAAVGNITGRVLTRGRTAHLLDRPGTLGTHLPVPTIRLQHARWEPGSTLILVSDGIRSGWNLEDHPNLLGRHPAIVAAVLHRDHGRPNDDATVLVVSHNTRMA